MRKIKEEFPPHLEELSTKIIGHLTLDEQDIIKDYTVDGYFDLNRWLRYPHEYTSKGTLTVSLETKKKTLISAITKYQLTQSSILYRGSGSRELGFDFWEFKNALRDGIITKGYQFQAKAFVSTSTSYNMAQNFQQGILIEIAMSAGMKAMPIHRTLSFLKGKEEEVLLAPGCKFEITEIEFIDETFHLFKVKCLTDGV